MKNITFDMVKALIPKRAPDSHKGDYGKVLAVCGCSFYRGAAALSVSGALKVGAGIVALASEECVIESIAALIPEAIFIPLPNDSLVLKRAAQYDCVLLGCGLMEGNETLLNVRRILSASFKTVVLDAGALMSCKKEPQLLKTETKRIIITPHMGEMAGLIGRDVSYVKENAQQIAQSFAVEYKLTVVLKGHRTIIASPDGELFVNTTGNPGLAKGGSGDVLSGMIAGFASQGLTPLKSSQAAVFLHGFAADLTAQRRSMQAMLPHQLLESLEEVFLKITN